MPLKDQTCFAITTIQMIAVCVLLWLVFFVPHRWDWQSVTGSVLMLMGLAGIAVARYQLGRSFAITPQARTLVTHGIYSKIRNPIYVSGSVMIAGFALLMHRPALWLFFIFVVVMQAFRAHREAQVLEAAFGEDYRQYRRKTWF